MADSLLHLGFGAWLQGDYERAAELGEETLAVCRGLGETHGTVMSLSILGAVAYHRGDYERGTKLLEEALALSREGYAEGVPFSLNDLGVGAYHRGEYEWATRLLKESLVLHEDLGDRWRVASVLEGLAEVACARGDYERATRLFGAGETSRETLGTPMPPCERANYEQGVAAAHAALDEASLNAAWAEGLAMPAEQAIEYALTAEVDSPAVTPPTTTLAAPEPPAGSVEKPTQTLPAEAKSTTDAGLRIFALGPARVERGRALEHYRSLVGVLDERLGAGPAPETRMLYEELRRGEVGTR
jgi:tetratricopeptide (TPR) repeat protein